jgi:hypothetical protein
VPKEVGNALRCGCVPPARRADRDLGRAAWCLVALPRPAAICARYPHASPECVAQGRIGRDDEFQIHDLLSVKFSAAVGKYSADCSHDH